jgi:hypothetical protein
MLDRRSPLMKRLAEIMPKKPEPQWEPNKMMRPPEYQPIRMAAESFASWMKDDLPANREELRALLWVFGEILNGEMERMLNESYRCHDDLLKVMPFTPQVVPQEREQDAIATITTPITDEMRVMLGNRVHLSEIGEFTLDDMENLKDTPPNSTLKFDHWSIFKEK